MSNGITGPRMPEQRPAPPTVSYATPEASTRRQSGYAIASICVAAISLAWFPLGLLMNLPSDVYKYHRIPNVLAVLSIILAIAAYRQPSRERMPAHVGMLLGLLALILHIVIVPL